MTKHILKSDPDHFSDVATGRKSFEIRKDDRNPRFDVGDHLILQEFDRTTRTYSGRIIEVRVQLVRRGAEVDGLAPGYALMSISRWTPVHGDTELVGKVEPPTKASTPPARFTPTPLADFTPPTIRTPAQPITAAYVAEVLSGLRDMVSRLERLPITDKAAVYLRTVYDTLREVDRMRVDAEMNCVDAKASLRAARDVVDSYKVAAESETPFRQRANDLLEKHLVGGYGRTHLELLCDLVERLAADRDAAIKERDAAIKEHVAAIKERDALQKFKTFVHKFLDDGDVPADPYPEETKVHGCRIGGRLKFLLGKWTREVSRAITVPAPVSPEETRLIEFLRDIERLSEDDALRTTGIGVAHRAEVEPRAPEWLGVRHKDCHIEAIGRWRFLIGLKALVSLCKWDANAKHTKPN